MKMRLDCTYSVKPLAELINEGAQIHPSFLAEQEYTEHFPNFSNLDQI